MIVSSRQAYGLFKWLLAAFLFSAKQVHAQKITFAHLSAEDGLSQNSILAITQDHLGFMWFGTRFGLNRYDAKRVMTYRASASSKGSLSNNYILSLLADSRKNLWVGTRNGLNRYRQQDGMFEQIAFEKAPGREVYINGIYEDRQKRIWIAANGGVYFIDNVDRPLLRSFHPWGNEPLGAVYTVFEDRKGLIWIGTEGGLLKITMDANATRVQKFKHDATDPKSLADNSVTSIAEDQNGSLWIGTLNGGLHMFDATNTQFKHYLHSGPNSLVNNHIRKILPDSNGLLWIGTQEGVSVLNPQTLQFNNYTNEPGDMSSLSQNSVHSLFMDNAGTVWIGTFFGGVNSYSAFFNRFTVYNNNADLFKLNNNVISSVVEDSRKNLWIGTEGGGLNYFDAKNGKMTYYRNDPARPTSIGSNLVKVIYTDRENQIWVGTHGGGLNRINDRGGNFSFTRYPYDAIGGDAPGLEISCLLEDNKGLLWVGTERRGLKPFIKTGDKLIADARYQTPLASLQNASVGCLLETSFRTLWIGTTEGVYELNGQVLKKLPATGNLTVNCLFEDAANNIWAGTANNGLVGFDNKGNRTVSYTKKDGLVQDNVLGILQDRSGRLWMSTGDGLVRMNADKTFKTFNRYDGLQGNTFNNNSYYKAADGKMFFGGYDGLVSFYPDSIKENKLPAPVFITGISFPQQANKESGNDAHYQRILPNTNLKLRYNQNVFTIDFAALNFINPGKNNYAYKLEGYDETWRFGAEPAASYTNVAPGAYIFWCKGSNNDGVWGDAVPLKITIKPPFWKTWWAYVIYVVLLISFVFFIAYFFYLRALFKRNNELTQLKLNFFTNISHEIRTHLSLIIAPAEKLIRSTDRTGANKQEAQTIKHNSESLMQLVNELMDFRKAETGHLSLHVTQNDVISFIDEVAASFAEMFTMKNITTTVQHLPGKTMLWFDKVQMGKVLFNLLSNAGKFTPEGGYIKVSLHENNNTITIQVLNNGKGIAKENVGKLFENYFQEHDYGQRNTGYGIGLALSKSIVELHNGHIKVNSEKQPGSTDHVTSFSIELLKGNHHFVEDQLSAVISQEPVRQVASSRTPEELVVSTRMQDTTTKGVKQTVLVVEDNKGISTFIKEVLQHQYIILESPDGQHGWELARESIPDLIISDVMMPVMDGFAFCEKLKTDIRTSHIPVILLTAKTSLENQVSGLQVGADVYLTKPFSIEVLELQVHNLLATKERIRKQFSRLLSGAAQNTDEVNSLSEAALEEQKRMLHPLDEAFLNDLIKLADDHMDNMDFGVAMLSRLVGMSQPVLLKKIKAITGMSANDFVKSLRLKKACRLLLENRYTVYEVAFMVGYENSKYFSKEFKKEFGKTPTEFTNAHMDN